MKDPFFQPVSGFDLPRYAGVPTFMRLPYVPPDHARFADVDIGLVGIPWDGGTSNRTGPRHGPRQLRDLSTMMRLEHGVTHVRPFEAANCADIGDVGPNPVDLPDTLDRITAFYRTLQQSGIRPLTAGGDHLCTLPILRALGADGPLAMIQFDSHTDLYDTHFGGFRYSHGTPFRRAIEEGLLDPTKMVQIGIRGSKADQTDLEYAAEVGVRIIPVHEFFDRGVAHVMDEARERVGDHPTYVTYDIDFVDPTFAPGTGTPEVGGPNSYQALQVVRALTGVKIVGADVVEVSPPFDQSGGTALLGATLMFELLCQMV
ncbi:MAG: agmatinase [Rhodobacteraceae bacterium]|nr:agmatinase [Paracoccaceae bacterium]